MSIDDGAHHRGRTRLPTRTRIAMLPTTTWGPRVPLAIILILLPACQSTLGISTRSSRSAAVATTGAAPSSAPASEPPSEQPSTGGAASSAVREESTSQQRSTGDARGPAVRESTPASAPASVPGPASTPAPERAGSPSADVANEPDGGAGTGVPIKMAHVYGARRADAEKTLREAGFRGRIVTEIVTEQTLGPVDFARA